MIHILNSKPVTSTIAALKKYLKFVGPGLMVSVAYMDPGNYATDVNAGALNKYSLLFIILLSNTIAIFLQILCIKLGSVTGLDLAKCCNKNFPKWLNYSLWALAEIAIIATDVAEVIGSAIALNVLIKVPLPAGVALTCVDILIVLMAYRPGSSIKFVKIFEMVVAALVFVVCICFCIQLSMINGNAREIFRGFAPSGQMFENGGMLTAASILGATVMPHSLFLGSALVQPRLRDYDIKQGIIKLEDDKTENEEKYYEYKPSLMAINYSLKYSIIELSITLFTFALFVNSAILIVSGNILYGSKEAATADLFTIHSLLSSDLSPVFGTIFMVALLFSGQSAGIVCTISGQIISEGHINWKLKPWVRRIVTRGIAIIPCLAISISIGRSGLKNALDISQVILSILLPFLIAPLIWFTCNKKLMKVEIKEYDDTNRDEDIELIDEMDHDTLRNRDVKNQNRECDQDIPENENNETSCGESNDDRTETEETNNYKDMSNNWITTCVAVIVWIFISVLNVYAIVDLGLNGLN